MHPQRKKRLSILVFIVSGIAIALGLVLYSLQQNINLYYTPSQLVADHVTPQSEVRIGGLVEKGSVQFAATGLLVSFILTDSHREIKVNYNGVLPTLFREGQGIVAQGKLNANGIFIADQVLAKHDSTYMPPGIKPNQSMNVAQNGS